MSATRALTLEAPETLATGRLFVVTLRLDTPLPLPMRVCLGCSHPALFNTYHATWPLQYTFPAGLDKLIVPLSVNTVLESVEVTFTAWEDGRDLFDPAHERVSVKVQITP